MKKNKSKQFLLAALTGLFLSVPVQNAYIPETLEAAQVSASHDSKLSALDIAPGVLSPAFSPDITEYTSTVDADVTSVRVQADPRASGAVIASVEGRDGLRPGVNTIKVTCSAQDNTYTVYTITLTVGSADAGAQQPEVTQPDADGAEDGQPQDGADNAQPDGQGADTQPEAGGTTAEPDAQDDAAKADTAQTQSKKSLAERLSGKVKADGTVKLSGASYKLSGNFTYGATSQDIPSAFGQGSAQIGDQNYQTLYCEANGIHLVYMENTDGKGTTGFYYYDEIKNAVERFKYTGIGDNFVVFISNAREELPAGYQEKALKFPSGKKVAAYQSQYTDELKDYYLVYGINSDASSGWYLYDKKQGTYLRYSSAFAAAQGPEGEDGGEEEVERTVSLTKYNSLNEKYTELKESRVKIVSILVITIVLLIIIFTALLLRGHDDEEEEQRGRKKKKSRKAGKQTEAVSKSSLAAGRDFEGNVSKKAKKVTKTFTQEPPEDVRVRPAYRDNISTPEEIRAQVSREQENRVKTDSVQRTGERVYGLQKEQPVYRQPPNGQYPKEQMQKEQIQKEQSAYGQMQKEQSAYGQMQKEQSAYGQMQNGERIRKSGSSTDSVQMAAERMRQSVKYPRKSLKAEPAEPEHDPMDDWDMEETVSRKPPKAGKASRKRRGYRDEDMEIMDLNDL